MPSNPDKPGYNPRYINNNELQHKSACELYDNFITFGSKSQMFVIPNHEQRNLLAFKTILSPIY